MTNDAAVLEELRKLRGEVHALRKHISRYLTMHVAASPNDRALRVVQDFSTDAAMGSGKQVITK